MKILGNTIIHVWKLIISSSNYDSENMTNNPNCSSGPNVVMKTMKICSQRLPLPAGVGIVHASPAAGHLRSVSITFLPQSHFIFSVVFFPISSSASIYPACFAPYAIVTACTDNTVRFWRCKSVDKSNRLSESMQWEEWQMISKEGVSLLDIPGTAGLKFQVSNSP